MLRFLVLLVLWGCALSGVGEAANHYIRDGASGDGSDWSNACDDFAGSCAVASMVRGDTYYVADGAYAARTFNKAASSNLVITIKKATASDHGTDTGWVSTYGDGQAIFSSPIVFSTDDWVLDGATRDESNAPLSWLTGSAYGFKISNNSNTAEQQVTFGAALDNFTMRYVWAEGRTGAFSGSERRYSIDTETAGTSTNLLFSKNLTTDSNQWYFLRNSNNTTIEYWAGDRLIGDEFNHGDAINCYFTADNVTIRWGIARDACTDGCTGMIPIADAIGSGTKPTVLIYGNLFYDYGSTDGTAGFLGNASNEGSCTNCVVRNNTFVDGGSQFAANWGLQFGAGSGNTNQNNIWFEVNSQTPSFDLGSGATNNYNLFGTSATSTGTNAQVSVPTTKFVDFAGKNFKLASATDCGAAVSPPYDVDMLGNIRGADGCVDRGAFEYCAGGCGGGGGSVGGSHPTGSPRMTPMLQLRRGN